MAIAPKRHKPDPGQIVIDPWAENAAWDRTVFAAATVAAVSFWYFSQPLLRLSNPAIVGPMGFIAGAGLASAWLIAGMGRNSPWKYVALAITSLACGPLGSALMEAGRASQHLDEQCRLIQIDMLSARPLRADDPAVFQAIGCRVQNVGQYAVPRSGLKALVGSPHSP